MERVYIDNVKTSVTAKAPNQTLAFKVTYRNGNTFVSRDTDKFTLLVAKPNSEHVFSIEATENYLGHLTFSVPSDFYTYFGKGTYLAEVAMKTEEGEVAIMPDDKYLEVTVS